MRRRTVCRTLRTKGRVQFVLLRGKKRSTERKESVSECAKRGVMMEAAPGAAFIVVETELAFEVLIVALDAPAQLADTDERA